MRFEVTLYCIIDILCFFMNNIFVLFVLNIETCLEETEAYFRSIEYHEDVEEVIIFVKLLSW